MQIDVKFEKDTVWLSQNQMSLLFAKSKKTINEHITNIYKEEELMKKDSLQQMRLSGISGLSTKPTNYYNLDMIISVGYRVNSKRGTQFRIRATQKLKEYLIQGYALNQKRLEETKLDELEQVVSLIKKNLEHGDLSHTELTGLLELATHYTSSRILLQKYDEGLLSLPTHQAECTAEISYQEAMKAIHEMKTNFLFSQYVSELFGIERNHAFQGILESIYQQFDGQELYPSTEEKAAHLLFFIVRDHPFADGNKKIGAFLFLRFLAKNNCLYTSSGTKKIDDHTLVALTLLVASCDSSQKEMMIKLIVNFITPPSPSSP
jgi:prophage maintenance system killer protein